jgi:hypothetical protein
MKKVTALFAALALLLVGAVGALAQTEWNVIAESGPLEIEVEGEEDAVPVDEVLDVSVSLTGDTTVEVDEENRYYVTVTNSAESNTTLDEWALGLSVGDEVESLDELTVTTPLSDLDLTDPENSETTGVDVEFDEEEGVVWLLGGVSHTVDPGQYLIRALDVTFHEANTYIATAYVVDVSEEEAVALESELSNGEGAEEGAEDEAEAEVSILEDVVE